MKGLLDFLEPKKERGVAHSSSFQESGHDPVYTFLLAFILGILENPLDILGSV